MISLLVNISSIVDPDDYHVPAVRLNNHAPISGAKPKVPFPISFEGLGSPTAGHSANRTKIVRTLP